MNIWAISDLHLSFARPDRRERYAERWRDHAEKLERNWREAVAAEDLVLLPGDISMARNHRDLQPDLDWLHRLPGTKILTPGNHDGWWNGAEAVRPILRSSIHAVEGDALAVAGIVVAGALSSPVPLEDSTPSQSLETDRTLTRMHTTLERAIAARTTSETPILVLWHHPPFDGHGRPGPWVPLMEQAQVTACVYGHLHTAAQWARTVQGSVHGIRYYCVSADSIGFRPLKIRLLAQGLQKTSNPR